MKRQIVVKIETDDTGEYCGIVCPIGGAVDKCMPDEYCPLIDGFLDLYNLGEKGHLYKRCQACLDAEKTAKELQEAYVLQTVRSGNVTQVTPKCANCKHSEYVKNAHLSKCVNPDSEYCQEGLPVHELCNEHEF